MEERRILWLQDYEMTAGEKEKIESILTRFSDWLALESSRIPAL